MDESRRAVELLRSSARSGNRVLRYRATTAMAVADRRTDMRLRQVSKPNSPSKTMRKVGVALLLSPDPITDIPGAIIIGASLAARKKDPLSAASVFDEARKVLAEIGFSLRRV